MVETRESRTADYINSIRDKVDVYKIIDLSTHDLDNQLKQKQNSELFQLCNQIANNEFDPNKQKPLQFLNYEGFEKLLNKKAQKIYLNKSRNTVYEYWEISHKFLPIKFLSFNTPNWVWKILNVKRTWLSITNSFLRTGFEIVGFKKYVRYNLIHYISLEVKLSESTSIDFYINKLAKLFNYLSDKNIITTTTLDKVFIVPMSFSNSIVINVFTGVMREDIKELNKLVGFDVFVREGDMIYNFDWSLIDKLK